jgi:hypothetical protein
MHFTVIMRRSFFRLSVGFHCHARLPVSLIPSPRNGFPIKILPSSETPKHQPGSLQSNPACTSFVPLDTNKTVPRIAILSIGVTPFYRPGGKTLNQTDLQVNVAFKPKEFDDVRFTSLKGKLGRFKCF